MAMGLMDEVRRVQQTPEQARHDADEAAGRRAAELELIVWDRVREGVTRAARGGQHEYTHYGDEFPPETGFMSGGFDCSSSICRRLRAEGFVAALMPTTDADGFPIRRLKVTW